VSNDSGVIENIDFQGFRTLRTIGNEAIVVFPRIPKYMTLNNFEWFEWPFYVKFSLLRTDFESKYYWLASRVLFTYLL